MVEIKRLEANKARERFITGARLVCAYEGEELFEKYRLEGAISLNALKNLGANLSTDDVLIFYCA